MRRNIYLTIIQYVICENKGVYLILAENKATENIKHDGSVNVNK